MRRVPHVRSVVAALTVLATACGGESLFTRAERAMDGCIAVRNPQFTSGRGADALATPLPADIEALASKFNQEFASERFSTVAKDAATQAILVCALVMASLYPHGDARALLAKYAGHPSPDVATAAKVLLAKRGS